MLIFSGLKSRAPTDLHPANSRFVDKCHLVRECIKCRFRSRVGGSFALPRPWAIYLAARHGGTISSPSVRAADKRFGYRRHKVPISSTLGVDFVAALPRFRFPIQPWLSVAHSLEKLISSRHWNNDILTAFRRYQPAADDIAVQATISSPSRARTGGTKWRKTSCPCQSYPTRAGNSIQWLVSA